jgi:hypothetical protein
MIMWRKVTVMPVRWDLQRDPFEAHPVVGAHSALLLLTEDVIQGAPDPRHKVCSVFLTQL